MINSDNIPPYFKASARLHRVLERARPDQLSALCSGSHVGPAVGGGGGNGLAGQGGGLGDDVWVARVH